MFTFMSVRIIFFLKDKIGRKNIFLGCLQKVSDFNINIYFRASILLPFNSEMERENILREYSKKKIFRKATPLERNNNAKTFKTFRF